MEHKDTKNMVIFIEHRDSENKIVMGTWVSCCSDLCRVCFIIFNWGTVANHDGAPPYGIHTIYFSSSFVFGSRRLSRTPITAERPMPLREKEPKERMAPPTPMVSVTEMMMMLRV